MFEMQIIVFAWDFDRAKAGRSIAARIPRIAMTTRSSIKVNPALHRRGIMLGLQFKTETIRFPKNL